MSLKVRISLVVAGGFTLAIAVLCGLSYFNTHRIMSGLFEGNQIALAASTSEQVNDWLAVRKQMIEAAATTIAGLDDHDKNQVLNVLHTTMKGGGFGDVYLGTEDGRFIDGSGWEAPADFKFKERPWYQTAEREMTTSQTAPYVDASTGKLIISLMAPLVRDGKLVGVVSSDIPLDAVQKMVLKVKVGTAGYALIVDHDGAIMVHPVKALIGKKLQGLGDSLARVQAEMTQHQQGLVSYEFKKEEKFLAYSAIPTTGWYLCVTDNTADIFGPLYHQLNLQLLVGVLFILLGGGFAFLLARSIAVPVGRVAHMITEMERGRFAMRLGMRRRDEIGGMARTMDTFAESLQNEVVATLQRLAGGDLSFTVAPRDSQDVLRQALKRLGADLNHVLGQAQMVGEQIAAGSSQVADSSQSLSQGATEQASSLEEITATIGETATQVAQNAENASQANRLAEQARSTAESGNEQMRQMVAAMSEINTASQNISKIIKVIDEIAFQTNLLALNAAVEAARAGQHGKGFAVVAEEVRNLAARSAKAAKETAELIEGSVHKTQNGSQIADRTAKALVEIVGDVTKVTDLVAEIAAASNEQSLGIAQVNQGLAQIDQVTQQNTANAEESAAAAEELSSQAAQLRQMLQHFRLDGADGESFTRQLTDRPTQDGRGPTGGEFVIPQLPGRATDY